MNHSVLHSAFKTVPFDLNGDGVHREYMGVTFDHKTTPFQDDPEIEHVVGADQFHNWGKTVSFRASCTLVVRSIRGVCKVVKWAASEGRRVRAAGFRHSWTYAHVPASALFQLNIPPLATSLVQMETL